jgi:hypothetical protein
MSNSKISALAAATTVAGTEVLPIVQSSATVKVAISNLNPGLSTILATKGGTGQTSYAVGDLLYADTTTTLAKLADVATGNALISGGVGVAPSWGKIGLTTHVSGTLPTANGGTNLTSFTANGVMYASSTSALATNSALTFDGTNLSTTGTATATKFIPTGGSSTGNGMYLPAANTVAWSANGAEAARIDSSGRFVMNGTSAYSSSVLTLQETSSLGIALALTNRNSTQTWALAVDSIAVDDKKLVFVDVAGGPTGRMTLYPNGDVEITGLAGIGSRAVTVNAAGVLSAVSDASLKEEVTGAHIAGLAEIMQIHPKMYRWKDDISKRGDDAAIELGFFADDVAPIIPSAAPKGKDGLYGFYDRSVTAALVKSIQEQQAIIQTLVDRITVLEGS